MVPICLSRRDNIRKCPIFKEELVFTSEFNLFETIDLAMKFQVNVHPVRDEDAVMNPVETLLR